MDNKTEQRANDMLQIVSQQRDSYANQVVSLYADLLALQRELDELKKDKEKAE